MAGPLTRRVQSPRTRARPSWCAQVDAAISSKPQPAGRNSPGCCSCMTTRCWTPAGSARRANSCMPSTAAAALPPRRCSASALMTSASVRACSSGLLRCGAGFSGCLTGTRGCSFPRASTGRWAGSIRFP